MPRPFPPSTLPGRFASAAESHGPQCAPFIRRHAPSLISIPCSLIPLLSIITTHFAQTAPPERMRVPSEQLELKDYPSGPTRVASIKVEPSEARLSRTCLRTPCAWPGQKPQSLLPLTSFCSTFYAHFAQTGRPVSPVTPFVFNSFRTLAKKTGDGIVILGQISMSLFRSPSYSFSEKPCGGPSRIHMRTRGNSFRALHVHSNVRVAAVRASVPILSGRGATGGFLC